ncbi:hypothetical protein BTN49_1643 [Candidatus Enterovibrio escicola]|uniref:Uncharacterized protein n=1 Tax=Candidatus Enterovibrio escicola TaxID=1927127 RepID=A0A2A5T3H0_9GAMM|nr:hypothetical protein BTN49_1643 [Candidatus Enterovibrio escacola]
MYGTHHALRRQTTQQQGTRAKRSTPFHLKSDGHLASL